jgi:oxamate amidohydrolase
LFLSANFLFAPTTAAEIVHYRFRLSAKRLGSLPNNTGAPIQGIASLMILALFDHLGVTEGDSTDHIHGPVEATKRAIRARNNQHSSATLNKGGYAFTAN